MEQSNERGNMVWSSVLTMSASATTRPPSAVRATPRGPPVPPSPRRPRTRRSPCAPTVAAAGVQPPAGGVVEPGPPAPEPPSPTRSLAASARARAAAPTRGAVRVLGRHRRRREPLGAVQRDAGEHHQRRLHAGEQQRQRRRHGAPRKRDDRCVRLACSQLFLQAAALTSRHMKSLAMTK